MIGTLRVRVPNNDLYISQQGDTCLVHIQWEMRKQ